MSISGAATPNPRKGNPTCWVGRHGNKLPGLPRTLLAKDRARKAGRF